MLKRRLASRAVGRKHAATRWRSLQNIAAVYASVFDSMLGGFGMGGGGGLQFSEDPIDDYGLDDELLLRLVSHVNVFSTR